MPQRWAQIDDSAGYGKFVGATPLRIPLQLHHSAIEMMPTLRRPTCRLGHHSESTVRPRNATACAALAIDLLEEASEQLSKAETREAAWQEAKRLGLTKMLCHHVVAMEQRALRAEAKRLGLLQAVAGACGLSPDQRTPNGLLPATARFLKTHHLVFKNLVNSDAASSIELNANSCCRHSFQSTALPAYSAPPVTAFQ